MSDVGFYNPLFFMGVVVANSDAANPGRVKVRVFGVHPPDPNTMQEETNSSDEGSNNLGMAVPQNVVYDHDLPWMSMLQGAVQGVPRVGDWVMGCFLDGRDAQHGMVFGVIPGSANGVPGPNPTGGNSYTPMLRDVVDRIGEPSLDPWLSGEQVSSTPAIVHSEWGNEGFAAGENQGGWQTPEVVVAGHNANGRVIRAGGSQFRVAVTENGAVITGDKGQIQIDGNGNVAIYSNGQVAVYGAQTNIASKSSINNNAKAAYTINSGAQGISLNTDGNITMNCGSFRVNARDDAYINAGGSADIRGAKVHVNAVTDNVDVWAKGKTRIYSGGTMTLEAGGFEGMFITTKRVNWFNYLDFKITSLLTLDINTPGKLKLSGSYSDFVGTAVANFKSNAVSNVYGSIVNIDKFVNMGSGASLPPLPLLPTEIGLHIGMPLGPLLSGHFATVPDLPQLKGSQIKLGGDVASNSFRSTSITGLSVDDQPDIDSSGIGSLTSLVNVNNILT